MPSVYNSSTATLESAGLTVVLTVPSNTQPGDILLATVVLPTADTATASINGNGWTYLDDDATLADTTKVSQAYRVCDGNEPSTYTWTATSAKLMTATMVVIRGSNGINTNAADTDTASAGTLTASFPSITTDENECLVLQIAMAHCNPAAGPGTFATPSGYSQVAQIQNSLGRVTTAVFSIVRASAGTVSGVTSSYSAGSQTGNCRSVSIAFESARNFRWVERTKGLRGRGIGW